MLSYPQRIGHNSERWVHRAAGTENTAINDVEIVNVVRFAVDVQSACFRIVPETHCADLVCNARQWDALADEQIAREKSFVAFVAVNVTLGLLLHQVFKLCYEPLVTFLIVGLVTKDDAAIVIQRYAVVGIGQVL